MRGVRELFAKTTSGLLGVNNKHHVVPFASRTVPKHAGSVSLTVGNVNRVGSQQNNPSADQCHDTGTIVETVYPR